MMEREKIGTEAYALALAKRVPEMPTSLIRGHPNCDVAVIEAVSGRAFPDRKPRRRHPLSGLSKKTRKTIENRVSAQSRRAQHLVDDVRVVGAVSADPKTTSGKIAKALNMDGKDVSRALRRLLTQRRVVKAGAARWETS